MYRQVSNIPFKLKNSGESGQCTHWASSYIKQLQVSYQSAYSMHHSTETALFTVHHDIVSVLDSNSCAVLSMLDLSLAFNVIDHSILVKRLNLSYGICGEAFRWIESYLNNRYQRAAVHPCQLIFNWVMEYLEPKLYCMFSKPICEICWRHRLSYHTYADDTQVYMVIKPWATLAARLEACLSDISDWKKTYMLKINQD